MPVERAFDIGDLVMMKGGYRTWKVVKFSYTSYINGAHVPRYDLVSVDGANRGSHRSDVLEFNLEKVK